MKVGRGHYSGTPSGVRRDGAMTAALLRTKADHMSPTVRRRSGPGHLALAFLLALLAGVLISLNGWQLDAAAVIESITCLGLLAPLVVAAIRLRRSATALLPVIVGVVIALVFLPGIVGFDPARGLVAAAGLTSAEAMSSSKLAELLLLIFVAPITVVFGWARFDGTVSKPTKKISDNGGQAEGVVSSVRVVPAFVLGLVASVVGIVIGLKQGVDARTLSPDAGGSVGGILSFMSTPVPGALWLARKRTLSLVILLLAIIGFYLIGGRQAVLTPLTLFLVAVAADNRFRSAPRDRHHRWRWYAGILLVALVAVAAVITVTLTKRATVDIALNNGKRPPIAESLLLNQSLFDPLVVAVAREERPQGLSIYERALAAPIPRAIWRDKPLSWDYDFRQRHFSHYEGGIPIGFAGTAFLSFLLPGVVAAGAFIGVLASAAARLFSQGTHRAVLLAGTVCLLASDIVRIGGLYRELLTFSVPAAIIFLITTHSPWSSRHWESAGQSAAKGILQ